jgi:hypothetical protein
MSGTQLREFALSLPDVQERETWGHPTFRVQGRIFVGLAEDETTANVKASTKEQAALLAADPATFSAAARVGRYGWVAVRLDGVDPAEMRELVVEAWRRTAPRRVVDEFDRA